MPLIDETYFIGELSIPNTGLQVIQEPLLHMIATREKELLTDLFGYEAYKALTAAEPDAKWLDVKNGKEYTVSGKLYKWDGLVQSTGKRSLIANYVYYWWQRNQATKTAGAGEVKPKAENSVTASPADKMVKAWNDMSDQINALYHFLYHNDDVYTEWEYFSYSAYPGNAWFGWYSWNSIFHSAAFTRSGNLRWKYEYINNFI